jgi:hypothetical protein
MTSNKTMKMKMTSELVVRFDDWLTTNRDEYRTVELAVKQWEAMCDGVGSVMEIDTPDEKELTLEDLEDVLNDLKDNYEVSHYDDEMDTAIEDAEVAFEEIGVKFHKNYQCCNTCGHAAAKATNYVFYHEQNEDDLREGARSVHLAFRFDEATKAKVLAMIEAQTADAIRLHWAGEEHTKIFLTCDDDLMAAHIKMDMERQAAMKEAEEEAALEAHYAAVKVRVAEAVRDGRITIRTTGFDKIEHVEAEDAPHPIHDNKEWLRLRAEEWEAESEVLEARRVLEEKEALLKAKEARRAELMKQLAELDE